MTGGSVRGHVSAGGACRTLIRYPLETYFREVGSRKGVCVLLLNHPLTRLATGLGRNPFRTPIRWVAATAVRPLA